MFTNYSALLQMKEWLEQLPRENERSEIQPAAPLEMDSPSPSPRCHWRWAPSVRCGHAMASTHKHELFQAQTAQGVATPGQQAQCSHVPSTRKGTERITLMINM